MALEIPAMALEIPVLLTLEEAMCLKRRKAVVSMFAAHKFLTLLRVSYIVPPGDCTEKCIELSSAASQGAFDWKGYVANRSVDQLEVVVGEGICRFEARFFIKFNRFDFVAHRIDGFCVRFQTHPTKDQLLVGKLGDWASTAGAGPMESKRIAEPVQVPGASRGSIDMCEILSKPDFIRPWEVLHLLDMHEHIWHGEGGKFATDLDVGKLAKSHFRYNLYLAGTSWGREIARIGVTSFWVVWVGRQWQQAGFYVKYGQQAGVLFPDKQGNPFLEAAQDIMWDI